MASLQLLVFAGPNGSGKSSITTFFPITGNYINADVIQAYLHCDTFTAAKKATATRNYCIEHKQSFTFETVLSSYHSVNTIQEAQRAGYDITMLYVLTCDPKINVSRVNARVAAGGHSVPEDKIISRYTKSLGLLPEVIPLCRRVLIFDNSDDRSSGGSPNLIVSIKDGHVSITPTAYWPKENILALLQGKYTPSESKSDFKG
jgi:predicted ABC-type ATPase